MLHSDSYAALAPNKSSKRTREKAARRLTPALGVMNRHAFLVALALLVTACGSTKSLPGGYELEKWEDGTTFYLNAPGNTTKSGGGAIEGTVQHIAWNKEIIAAERYANFRGDPDGWMIINVKTKQISGPLSEEKFLELRSKEQLQVRTAAEAWSAL